MKVKMGHVDEMEWLGDRGAGVYLVQLKQNHAVGHCIFVMGISCVVLGSADRYPLVPSVVVFKLCGGDAATNLRFGEVREVAQECSKNFEKRNRKDVVDFLH